MNLTKSSLRHLAPLGYLWGALLALASPAFFLFNDSLSHALAQLPFMKNHPIYSGGEVSRVESDGNTEWRIHRPVFDGLFSNTERGFVQIDVAWQGEQPRDSVRSIDYNNDGAADFILTIPADKDGEPSISTLSPSVTGIERRAATRNGWIVRVGLGHQANTTSNNTLNP